MVLNKSVKRPPPHKKKNKMIIENIELDEATITNLIEVCSAYENTMKALRSKGLEYPERAAKEAMNQINEGIETIEETVDSSLLNVDSFSTYFNVGSAAGATFEEIREAYESRDMTFIVESSFFNGINQRVNSLKNIGHKIHNLSVTTRGGVPHAEFLSTDKNNNRVRHIVHGNSTTTANLGKAAPSQDAREADSI